MRNNKGVNHSMEFEYYTNNEFQIAYYIDTDIIKKLATKVTQKIIDIKVFKDSERIHIVGIYGEKLNLGEMTKFYTEMRI